VTPTDVVAVAVPYHERRVAERWWRARVALPAASWSVVPSAASLFAALLILSRRPDAVFGAQLWAEDGRLTVANVYQHGLLATMLLPQAGYFNELQALTASFALHVAPLTLVPAAMNSIAITVRVLPVGLLLSDRARTITPDRRVRGLLAGLYIALPGFYDTDANVDNAIWYLAIAAALVLVLAPASLSR
jgi:hypothetical protein